MTDIAALRENKGISQVDLARMANMDVRTLRRIEKGEGASEHMIERVLTALGRTMPMDGPVEGVIDRSLVLVGKAGPSDSASIQGLAFVVAMYLTLSPFVALWLLSIGEPVGLSDPAGQTMAAIYALCILLVVMAARRTSKLRASARPAASVVLDAIRSGRMTVIDEDTAKLLYKLAGSDAFLDACNAPRADLLIQGR